MICRAQAPKQQQSWSHKFCVASSEEECRTWARAYQSFQPSKDFRHTVTPLGDITPPTIRFLHTHIDLVGPLPTSAGYTYCLNVVERFTCWPEFVPIPDITADIMARALLTGWISRRPPPQTRDVSLNPNSSNPWPGCAAFGSHGWPTIPLLTESWNVSTGDRRQPSCATWTKSGQRRFPCSSQNLHSIQRGPTVISC
jgi:hypothetical protein